MLQTFYGLLITLLVLSAVVTRDSNASAVWSLETNPEEGRRFRGVPHPTVARRNLLNDGFFALPSAVVHRQAAAAQQLRKVRAQTLAAQRAAKVAPPPRPPPSPPPIHRGRHPLTNPQQKNHVEVACLGDTLSSEYPLWLQSFLGRGYKVSTFMLHCAAVLSGASPSCFEKSRQSCACENGFWAVWPFDGRFQEWDMITGYGRLLQQHLKDWEGWNGESEGEDRAFTEQHPPKQSHFPHEWKLMREHGAALRLQLGKWAAVEGKGAEHVLNATSEHRGLVKSYQHNLQKRSSRWDALMDSAKGQAMTEGELRRYRRTTSDWHWLHTHGEMIRRQTQEWRAHSEKVNPESQAYLPPPKPDIVIFMLGTTEMRKGNPAVLNHSQFLSDYSRMINASKNLKPMPTVFIMLPPPIYAAPSSSTRVDDVLKLIKRVAAENEVELIDGFSALGGVNKLKSGLMQQDGLHPSQKGACALAATAMRTIEASALWKAAKERLKSNFSRGFNFDNLTPFQC